MLPCCIVWLAQASGELCKLGNITVLHPVMVSIFELVSRSDSSTTVHAYQRLHMRGGKPHKVPLSGSMLMGAYSDANMAISLRV